MTRDAREQFGRRAKAYSKGVFSNPAHIKTIVGLSGVKQGDRVLDVATGGGFLACEFAKVAHDVVGLDLTPEMLETAEMVKKGASLTNVSFRTGDVEDLPFDNGYFDVVSCRFAFHHFPDPKRALMEMALVLKKGGRLVLVDGVSSEDPAKSAYMNEIEKLRDASHVKIYPLSELKDMMRSLGLTILKIKHWPLDQDVEEWIERAAPEEDKAGEIRSMLKESMKDDKTELNVRWEGEGLKFTYDTVILVAMKQ